MYTRKGMHATIWAIIGIILLLFGAHWGLNKAIEVKQSQIDAEPVTITYSKMLKEEAYDKKHASKPTAQQIAQRIMLRSVGLGGKQTGYDLTGINKQDGIFVKQGVLNGNMIPYSSNFTDLNDKQGMVKDFDADDAAYWNQVNINDFKRLKNNAQQQVDNYRNNNSKYQEQEMENTVRQAQYDANHRRAKTHSKNN